MSCFEEPKPRGYADTALVVRGCMEYKKKISTQTKKGKKEPNEGETKTKRKKKDFFKAPKTLPIHTAVDAYSGE